jgi:MFS family permease
MDQSIPSTTEQSAGNPAEPPWPSPSVGWYAVGVFALALMVAILDRGIITLLVEPIKRDLKLTDTQFSALVGFAFVFFYAFLGLPLSRLVDTKSRRVIIAAGIASWSVMTALCGVAQNFWQLFLFRVGVGAGESINGPATYSMIADLFPHAKLPRAIAVLNFGFVAGLGFSLLAGALVIHVLKDVPDIAVPLIGTIRNWQLVFLAIALPGLLVAVLATTVPEPLRRGLTTKGPQRSLPLRDVVRFLIQNRKVYGPMFLGLGTNTVYVFGMIAWQPAFFFRSFGWAPQKYAVIFGCLSLVTSSAGLVIGTMLAEWLHRKGHDDANIRVLVISYICAAPFAILGPLMPNPWLALACAGMLSMVGLMAAPAQNAAIQIITPNQMRGQVTALFLFVFAVVGSGGGPTFVAAIADYVLHSEARINYALAISAGLLAPLSAVIVALGLKAYGRRVGELRLAAG